MDKYHNFIHPFTGVNMVDVYKELIEKEGCKANIVLSNNPTDILKYTNDVIICDIHTRFETKKKIRKTKCKYTYDVRHIKQKYKWIWI